MPKKGVFNGHSPRQHRETARKGGLARIAKRTREEQRRDSAKGGEANRQRWVKKRAQQIDADVD